MQEVMIFIPDVSLGIGIIIGLIGVYWMANALDTKSYPGREYVALGFAVFACLCTAGIAILTMSTMMSN